MNGTTVHFGVLTIKLYLPGCASLKQKRGVLKPVLASLHKKFNVSAAEIGAHDYHQSAVLAVGLVSNSQQHIQPILEKIPDWIERNRPDVQIVDSEYNML